MSQAADQPHQQRISIVHLALLTPWVVVVIGAWKSITDNSFLWHVRAGTVQIERGAVLTTDPFSFTMAGEPWRTQSWLAELLYGWAEGLTGLGFVPYMLMVVPILTFLGIGLVTYRRSASVPATAVVVMLSILVLVGFLVPRPVLLSYLLAILVVLAWDRPERRWALPFLFWVWAAVHASFVIGLVYVGLSLLINREWRAIPKVVVSGLVTLGTAHGTGVVEFLVGFIANRDALQYLAEWRRPELLETLFLPFLGGMVLIVLGAFRQRILPRHLWLIVPLVLMGMNSVRAVPTAWLFLVPLVATSLSGLEIGSRIGQRPHLAAVFTLLVLVFPFFLTSEGELSDERFPTAAAEHLEDVPTLHDDIAGGYLIWAQGPERLVYIDDRAELFGGRIGEFIDMRRGDVEWEPIFGREGIQQILLKNEEPLIERLSDAGWQIAYSDDVYTVSRP